MSKVRVAGFGVSLDGFGAGIEQSLDDPLGKRGPEMFQWFFHTKTFCSMVGKEGGTTGDVDDMFAQRAMENFGAFILGRNMFGPVRGPWPDDSWKGWWGDNPPYHAPTFVLTHYEREPLVMEGGTTFHFVTGGFEEALVAREEGCRQQRHQDRRRRGHGAAVSESRPDRLASHRVGTRSSWSRRVAVRWSGPSCVGVFRNRTQDFGICDPSCARESVETGPSGKDFIAWEQGALHKR